jgi:hypothetical protein
LQSPFEALLHYGLAMLGNRYQLTIAFAETASYATVPEKVLFGPVRFRKKSYDVPVPYPRVPTLLIFGEAFQLEMSSIL